MALTDWQDYTVWAIGLLVAAILVRRIVCLFRGRRRGGCASCASSGCPLHGRRNDTSADRHRNKKQ